MTTGDPKIRNGTAKDLSPIQVIENASFGDPYSSMVFWSLYLNPKSVFRVATIDGKVIGYLIMKLESEKNGVISHIVSLAVDPNFRGKGVGTRLVDDAVTQTKRVFQRATTIMLEVRADNEIALSLYSQHGFDRIGLISNYYENGKDAVVMKLDLRKLNLH